MSTLTGLSLLEAHYTEVAAHSPVIERAANRLRSELDASDGIYEDMTSSGASAKLIQSLKELIAAGGGEARTISIDPATSSTTLEKLHVSLDATLPPSRLGKVLELVQARRPYIFVETLELSAASFTSVQGQLWLKMKIAAFREIHHAPN